MRSHSTPAIALLVIAFFAGPAVGRARAQQAGSIWPDHAENLQVLPQDFPPERLRAVMRGFTQALGVRCSYCHVGEEGKPLTTYDFASDENPNKDRARRMYRILGMVNRELRDFPSSGDERVNMWCNTCHHGKPRPQTLAEALGETYTAQGGDSTLSRYVALRERFYGSDAYDFTPSNVNAVASGFFQQGDTATALLFFRRNVEDNPKWAEGWESLGDVAAARGDRAGARDYYEKALALDPDNARIRASLQRARGVGG